MGYTMVKNESEKIIKKQKEEEMRRIMQAGLDKIQAKLDAAVAEREAVEATNANWPKTRPVSLERSKPWALSLLVTWLKSKRAKRSWMPPTRSSTLSNKRYPKRLPT